MTLTWKAKINGNLLVAEAYGCRFAICKLDNSLNVAATRIDEFVPLTNKPEEYMSKILEYLTKHGKIC